MKHLKRIALVVATLVIISTISIYVFLKSSLAPMDGTVPLQNLSQPVEVRRDTYGIPHIKAQNKLDALRALGFVQASERLFQMEISRRMTQGQLSEVFGDVALNSDKLYRSLMLRRSVERMLAEEKRNGTFDGKLWQEMEAYFDGVNQYVNNHPLPYELKILGITPRPFEPIDAFIMTGHMAYSFGIALKADPLMTKLAQTLPPDFFQNLRNDMLSAPLKIVQNSAKPFDLVTEGQFTPSFEGSNAWLIGPERSQSGKSIFANDPHIGYSSPAVWFEAHIQTPEFELYGHYLPLVPFAVLGHNRHHAWGFTMSLSDDMDLYREKLDRQNKTVIFNKKPMPYQEWQEVIKIKNQPDLVLPMIETPHGPVLEHTLTENNLSLKWAFHRLENNPMKALKKMAESKDISEFEQALKLATAPGLNVMYADADNIAWWIFGDIAVKKNPNSDMILDGATGTDEYTGYLAWNDKPHEVNPASGVIVTANSRPQGLNTNIRGDFQSDDRYQTIIKALSEKDQWNPEDIKSLQTENYNYQTKNILDKLFENLKLNDADTKKYAKQIELLKSWNLHSETDSVAASLYHQWNNEIILLMLKDLEPETKAEYLNTPYAWVFYERTILNANSPWWSKLNAGEVITTGFKTAMQKLEHLPTWGELHTIEYVHPLGRKAPLNLVFNLGPYPIPGAYNEINNNKMKSLGSDFSVRAGPSTRRIIDFASPQKSWGINPIGNSGHILSPYYKDQAQMFLKGQYRAQLMDEGDIKKATAHLMVLK